MNADRRSQEDEEGSFAAGRQALLDALQTLEQRAQERAERMIRDAERTARQTVASAEQRARQIMLESVARMADLEQQLAEVGNQLEAARTQIEEHVVSVHSDLELARATLNTARQQLTSSASLRPGEVAPQRLQDEVGPTLEALRATVEALRRPVSVEVGEADEQ